MSKTFSVVTYNVHSCMGMDRKLSPLRIAEVIDRCNADIVALQELDAGLPRTQMIDQAHLIAMTLDMSFHFHSSIHMKEGGYGNAVLSRGEVRLTKVGAVPTDPAHPSFERRGAVWVEVELRGHKIQVLATHFGLNRGERVSPARAMTGHEWLGHQECRSPALLCGDFNAMAGSHVYRLLTRHLECQADDHEARLSRYQPDPTFENSALPDALEPIARVVDPEKPIDNEFLFESLTKSELGSFARGIFKLSQMIIGL